MQLTDHVAIITGAGRGIGLGIAEAFCREGAHVIIGELVAERGEEAAVRLRAQGFAAAAIQLDVTQPPSCLFVDEPSTALKRMRQIAHDALRRGYTLFDFHRMKIKRIEAI